MDKRVWVVAAWEFKRYFKWKGELFSLFLIAVLATASFGGQGLIARLMEDDPAHIAVIQPDLGNNAASPLTSAPSELLLFEYHRPDAEPELMNRIAAENLDGILYLGAEQTRLLVFEDPGWLDTLTDYLSLALQNQRLQTRQMTPDDLAVIRAPAQLQVSYHPDGNLPSSTGERVFAIVVLVLMLIGILTSFGLFFISITSEKQQRVTEQIISAVSAQTWIDGKLMGISAMSLKSMFTTGLTAFLGILLYSQFSHQPFLMSGLSGNPLTLFGMLLFGVGGLLFWNCFLAAVAATVSDPNTSTRTPLMFLPALSIGIGFAGLSQPDSLGMQLLSWFPLTSMGVMPMRLALGQVAFWEIILALVLLVLATFWLRRMASRIFEVSMLIYGKEPKWGEMIRWLKET